MQCKSCNIALSGKAFCPGCGKPAAECGVSAQPEPATTCRFCHKALKKPGAAFCGLCGQSQVVQPSSPPEPTIPEPVSVSAPVPVSELVPSDPKPEPEPRPLVVDNVNFESKGTPKVTTSPTTEPVFRSGDAVISEPVSGPTPEAPLVAPILETVQIPATPPVTDVDAAVIKLVVSEDPPTPQGFTSKQPDAGLGQERQPSFTQSPKDDPEISAQSVESKAALAKEFEEQKAKLAQEDALKAHRSKKVIIIGAIVALVFCIAAGLAYFFSAPKGSETSVTPSETTAPAPEAPAALEVVNPEEATLVEAEAPVTPEDAPIPVEPEQTAAEKATAEKAAAAKTAAAKAAKEKAAADKAAKKQEAELQRLQEQARKDKAAQDPQRASASAAATAPQRSCSDAFFLSRPLCVIEGPKTFWKCSPDGKNWDNSIPGCARQSQ